jgi:predicted N-formylglutamate amidohydrolase
VKIAIIPKAFYRANAVIIKIPTQFFADKERATLKFISKNKKLSIAKHFSAIKNTQKNHHSKLQSVLQSNSDKKKKNLMVLVHRYTSLSVEYIQRPRSKPR